MAVVIKIKLLSWNLFILNPVIDIFVASRQKCLKPGLKIERFHDKSLILGHFGHYVPFKSASLDLRNLSQNAIKKVFGFSSIQSA